MVTQELYTLEDIVEDPELKASVTEVITEQVAQVVQHLRRDGRRCGFCETGQAQAPGRVRLERRIHDVIVCSENPPPYSTSRK